MRCSSYSTCEKYDVDSLFLSRKEDLGGRKFRDVFHFKKDSGDVFCFPFGSVILWNFSEEEEKAILNDLSLYRVHIEKIVESDFYTFRYNKQFGMQENEIILQTQDIELKLAVSHALAQSSKLGMFEKKIGQTISVAKCFPQELAKKGKISLSRKEISKKMGHLFMELSDVNLHTEILDTPEFFWEHPQLEEYYTFVAKYLDIEQRVKVLNMRLGVVGKLYDMLNSELQHEHSSRLEWTIILLIVLEVILVVATDIMQYYGG